MDLFCFDGGLLTQNCYGPRTCLIWHCPWN